MKTIERVENEVRSYGVSIEKINEIIDAVNVLQEAWKSDHRRLFELERHTNIKSNGPQETKEEPVEHELVPEEIQFTAAKRGYGGMGLWMGENQELYYNEEAEMWGVADRYDKKVKCKLVPCKLEDIQIGEWLYRGVFGKDNIDSYFLRVKGHDYVYTDKFGQIKKRTNYTDEEVYKVTPME